MPRRTPTAATLPPALTVAHIDAADAVLRQHLRDGGDQTLDLSSVVRIDSAGAALLAVHAERLRHDGRRLQIVGANAEVAALLSMLPATSSQRSAAATTTSLQAMGDTATAALRALTQLTSLAADTLFFVVATLFGRFRLRPGAVAFELAQIGSRALGVVGLIAFLVGATMALQSAAQLRRFGADLFVVDLVALSMLRELGPLMAAIVVAGRSGSAIAAEIGTMVVTEEIDALRALGLDPVRFVVVPKALAFSLAQPLLTVFANVLGVAGGMVVAVGYLDISADAFVQRLQDQIELRDVASGLGKSLVFAWLICLVGVHFGLATRGGADAVGRSATSAVVTSIFAVVLADAVASILLWF